MCAIDGCSDIHFTLHFSENNEVLFQDPFTYCKMPSFLNNDHLLDTLQNELFDQIFIEKNNDLYKFQQVKQNRRK